MRPVSTFQFLVSVWALVAVPAMCSGGVLTHPCDPEELHPCHPSHGSDDSSDHDHESDCLRDPCQIIGLRADDRSDGSPFRGCVIAALASSVLLNGGWNIEPYIDGSPPEGASGPSVWPAATSTILRI